MSLWKKLRGALSGPPAGTKKTPATAVEVAPPSPEDHLAAELAAAFREDPEVTGIERVPGEFALRITRGREESTSHLGNLFDDVRDASPEVRAAILRRHVRAFRSAREVGNDWDDVRHRLLPVLRGVSTFANLSAEAMPLSRPFAPCLVFALAVDTADSIRYANETDLPAWERSEEDAFAAALENSSRCFSDADIESYDPRAPYPIWHVASDDSYESSRLLLPQWLAGFEERVRGRPVAIAPQRGLCIIGGDGDIGCLQRLLTSARSEFQASARRISPLLYTADDKRNVVPFNLHANHPLYAELQLSRFIFADYEYDQQKRALDPRLGEEAFVASHTAMKLADGLVTSYAVWTKGVPTLLPKVDHLALLDADSKSVGNEAFRVRWDDFFRICGSLLEPVVGLNPPRWSTGAWPSLSQLGELRVLAIE